MIYVSLSPPAGEFHGLCQKLYQICPVDVCFVAEGKWTAIPKYELVALAYVIVTIKLLLGLNDFTER